MLVRFDQGSQLSVLGATAERLPTANRDGALNRARNQFGVLPRPKQVRAKTNDLMIRRNRIRDLDPSWAEDQEEGEKD
jgi:hypothetical protein